jgi:hypothetical protein
MHGFAITAINVDKGHSVNGGEYYNRFSGKYASKQSVNINLYSNELF